MFAALRLHFDFFLHILHLLTSLVVVVLAMLFLFFKPFLSFVCVLGIVFVSPHILPNCAQRLRRAKYKTTTKNFNSYTHSAL